MCDTSFRSTMHISFSKYLHSITFMDIGIHWFQHINYNGRSGCGENVPCLWAWSSISRNGSNAAWAHSKGTLAGPLGTFTSSGSKEEAWRASSGQLGNASSGHPGLVLCRDMMILISAGRCVTETAIVFHPKSCKCILLNLYHINSCMNTCPD